MGLLFREAFERRMEKADEDTLVEVFNAFFTEVEVDEELIVPLDVSRGVDKAEPMLLEIGPNEAAACVISDLDFIKAYEGQLYAIINAREFMALVKNNKFIKGIVINPHSEQACYMPREETFQVLADNHIMI